MWALCAPCRRSWVRFVISLLVAARVRWTPSGNRKPSFRLPSWRWKEGSWATNWTPRPSQVTLRQAFRALIESVTSSPRFLEQMLLTVTDANSSLAHSTRSSNSGIKSVTGVDYLTHTSQSLPPTTRTRRCSFRSVGNGHTFSFMSVTLGIQKFRFVYISNYTASDDRRTRCFGKTRQEFRTRRAGNITYFGLQFCVFR